VDNKKFAVIGTGVVGTAIVLLLEEAGYKCIGVNTRSRNSYYNFTKYIYRDHLQLEEIVQKADIIFITTQDSEIERVAEELSALKKHLSGQVWVHCSGAIKAGVMCRDANLSVRYLSIHPLQAFADVESALTLINGTHFGIEGGDREIEQFGEILVKNIGGIPHRIKPQNKALYHAGAVAASNYMVSLASLAVKFFTLAGISKDDAIESLLPLMKGSFQNIENVGLPLALTGPIARGDTEVVAKHLEQIPLELQDAYKSLGRLALEMGEERKIMNGQAYSIKEQREFEHLLS